MGSILHADFENVYRVFGAIIFAALAVGAVGTFIPDAGVAKKSAKTTFEIIDRSPRIDGTSELGVKPDTIHGKITSKSSLLTQLAPS